MNIDEALRSVALPMLRFGYYAATALLFGAVPILLLVVRPGFMRFSGRQWDAARELVARRLEGLVRGALVAAAVTTALALVIQAIVVAEFTGGELTISSFGSVFETSFGRWYSVRFPVLAALAVLLVNEVRAGALAGTGDDRRGPGTVWWSLWFVLAGVLLATNSFSGHAAVGNPRALSLVNDVVHLTSGGVWLTGVIMLAIVMPEAWARRGPDGIDLMANVVVRFSRIAPIAISMVAATGLFNALIHLEALGDLSGSSYGRALAIKLVFFASILSLGAINHWVVGRRMKRLQDDRRAAARLFRRTIAAEVAIGLIIIGTTGVLAGLPRTKEVGRSAASATIATQ